MEEKRCEPEDASVFFFLYFLFNFLRFEEHENNANYPKSRRMPSVKMVCVSRDETELIRPFILYHGKLFGYKKRTSQLSIAATSVPKSRESRESSEKTGEYRG